MYYSFALEHARSGRSQCRGHCQEEGKLIPKGCWRFGSVTEVNGIPMTFWRCLKCVTPHQIRNLLNMFGHWNVFFPHGLPADEMSLLESFFQLTLNYKKETVRERLEIIRQLNRGLDEKVGVKGEGGGQDRDETEEEAAAVAASSAGGKAKKSNNKRKLKKEESEDEEEEDDEQTVFLPVKRAAKKRPAKPTEWELLVLKAVLAEGGSADIPAIHKHVAEILGIAKYRAGPINNSVTRAVGKGLLAAAEEKMMEEKPEEMKEAKQEVKQEEKERKEGGEESGDEGGEEVEIKACGFPRRRRTASKKKMEAVATVTVYRLTRRGEQVLGGGPVEGEGSTAAGAAVAATGAEEEAGGGGKRRGRKHAVKQEEVARASRAAIATAEAHAAAIGALAAAGAAAGGGGGGGRRAQDVNVETLSGRKARKTNKKKKFLEAVAAACVVRGGGEGTASSSSGTTSAMAYMGTAAYGGGGAGPERKKEGSVVDNVRLKRALSQRFACISGVLCGARGLVEEGTYNPSGIFQVASFNSGSTYTVTFEVVNSGREGVERKCVGTCTCPDDQKQGSRYACKHQMFVAVRVLGMAPVMLQAGQGLPVAEFAIALNADRLAHLRLESLTAAAAAVAHPAPALNGPSAPQKPLTAELECAICFEIILKEDGSHDHLSYCVQCGQSVHTECQEQWNRSSNHGTGGTCVYCRSGGTVKAALRLGVRERRERETEKKEVREEDRDTTFIA